MVKNKIDHSWTDALLTWYDEHKRDLPWRDTGNPYYIWVSEVMSQQTRIEAMRPYYESWMAQFPTMEDLALAHEDTVVKAWQGLGYYSRARNLHAGVKEVVQSYGGVVPKNRKDIERLKGVGSYTAGAILSMAYNLPEVAVDGNVLRVYARLYNIDEDILSTKGRRTITALVEETLPHDRPGDFNQSLMDFGASICIPKSPRCGICPISFSCIAHEEGKEKELPVRIKKTKVKTVSILTLLAELNGYYLLHKRDDTGLLRSMWEFPNIEGESLETGREKLERLISELGLEVQIADAKIGEVTHVFSHRKWIMEAYRGKLKEKAPFWKIKTVESATMENIATKGGVIQGVTAEDEIIENTGTTENTTTVEGEEPVFMELLEKGRIIPIKKRWILIKKEDFEVLPWAGPHGKFIELCEER